MQNYQQLPSTRPLFHHSPPPSFISSPSQLFSLHSSGLEVPVCISSSSCLSPLVSPYCSATYPTHRYSPFSCDFSNFLCHFPSNHLFKWFYLFRYLSSHFSFLSLHISFVLLSNSQYLSCEEFITFLLTSIRSKISSIIHTFLPLLFSFGILAFAALIRALCNTLQSSSTPSPSTSSHKILYLLLVDASTAYCSLTFPFLRYIFQFLFTFFVLFVLLNFTHISVTTRT